MITLALTPETAAALQILLQNLSPMMYEHTAQKCAALYGGEQAQFYRRLTNAADDTVNALKVRANFELACS